MRQREIERVVLGSSAFLVQRIWRGHQGRKFWRVVRRIRATVTMQKVVRGFLDRRVVMRKHQHLALLQKRHSASVKVCAPSHLTRIEPRSFFFPISN